MKWIEEIKAKIKEDKITVGIVGLGYVGLPLAVTFSDKFKVIGYDINEEIIDRLRKGISHIDDVTNEELGKSHIHPTADPRNLHSCDFILVTVPTPLQMDKTPDLSYVKSSAKMVGNILRKGQFVILESTTYPGTTEEIFIPILEENSGLKIGNDFGVAYSPERVDPGNTKFKIKNTPKVVGGYTKDHTEVAAMFYEKFIKKVIRVKNCQTAEAVKMVENIFRNVNIALVNELALIFEKMGIDIWEVIEGAKTKPYGFMAFYPGPGIGGHCIPLDPYYLSYRAKQYGMIPRFIETAGEINDYMPIHTVNLVEKGLQQIGKKIRDAKIAVFGLAYKSNISDTRESPAKKIIEELIERGANIKAYDPFVDSIHTRFGTIYSDSRMDTVIQWCDCIILTIDHDQFKKESFIKRLNSVSKDENLVIIDGKNILSNLDTILPDIIYIKIGGKNQ